MKHNKFYSIYWGGTLEVYQRLKFREDHNHEMVHKVLGECKVKKNKNILNFLKQCVSSDSRFSFARSMTGSL